ncbi:MAG: right-handed parallel beta-helix repeat-containing protein [Oscillospiraceae bacterium]|nr:right-handed parallel beta-helix repeat-containing protein [Oscillospiraceae bacterium]
MMKKILSCLIVSAVLSSPMTVLPLNAAVSVSSDGYAVITAADWGIVQNSAHNNEATARANTKAMQNAIDTLYSQGHRKIRLEKMDITIWGAHPTGASSWGGNPYNNHETGIVMRTGMSFDMNGSTFRLATNDRPRYCLIMVGVPHTEYTWTQETGSQVNPNGAEYTTDVEVFNGTLIGDRAMHDYTKLVSDSGTVSSHEWGMGISINFNTERVKIHNMVVKDVTGDCITFDGKNHEIYNNTISGGRRNGICATGTKHAPANGVKIYNNTIFDIYNDVVIPELTHNQSGRSQYQTANGITYGIGAQACIAFEGEGIFNIEIYNNYLNAISDSPFDFGSAINFHWGSLGIHVRDNIIHGRFYFNCGSYIILERNKIFNGGITVSAVGTTYNGHLTPTPETIREGKSDLRNVIFIDNYFHNSDIYFNGRPTFPDEPGQFGPANIAFIGNHFVNGEIALHRAIRVAIIGNVFNATERRHDAIKVYLTDPPRTDGEFVYAFIDNYVQIIEDGTWNGNTHGWRQVRKFVYGGGLTDIRMNGVITPQKEAEASNFPWYRETDDPAKVTAFLKDFQILGPYVLPVWTNWYNEFMKTHENRYTANNDKKNLPLYNGGTLPAGGYKPPYTLDDELKKFYEKQSAPLVITPPETIAIPPETTEPPPETTETIETIEIIEPSPLPETTATPPATTAPPITETEPEPAEYEDILPIEDDEKKPNNAIIPAIIIAAIVLVGGAILLIVLIKKRKSNA